jgi:hypothetical protein
VREHHRPEGKHLSRLVALLAVLVSGLQRSIVLAFLRWGRALRGSTPAERIAKNPETSHPVRIDTAKTNRDGERMP